MVNTLPENIIKVSVKDQPSAFWTSLGFIRNTKNDDMLVYSDPLAHKTY